MNILAVDTSGPVAGIAILKDGCVTFEETVVNKLTHSANLMPMIDAALTRTGEKLSDRVAAMGGEAGEPFFTESEDGSSSLILPLRFSTLEGNAPMAFRFFVNLLLSRDLGWLTAGE